MEHICNVYNMSSSVVLNIESRAEGKFWNENMETFVFFKNGEDSNNFSRENSSKSSWKAVLYNH